MTFFKNRSIWSYDSSKWPYWRDNHESGSIFSLRWLVLEISRPTWNGHASRNTPPFPVFCHSHSFICIQLWLIGTQIDQESHTDPHRYRDFLYIFLLSELRKWKVWEVILLESRIMSLFPIRGITHSPMKENNLNIAKHFQKKAWRSEKNPQRKNVPSVSNRGQKVKKWYFL